jgi:hypothetical protein
MSLREQTKVTFIVDEDAMREIVEEEGLEGDAAERAIQRILSQAEEIDLNALARHVFEATYIDLSEFEPEDDD